MKKIVILTAAFLVMGCALALYVRGSLPNRYNDHLASKAIYLVTPCDDTDIEGTREYLQLLTQYLLKQDMIAKVRFTGHREAIYGATLSEVEVLEVFKGDSALERTKIEIYEYADYSDWGGKTGYRLFTMTNLMKEDNEYYIFVNNTELPTSSGVLRFTGDVNALDGSRSNNGELDAYWFPSIYPTDAYQDLVLEVSHKQLVERTLCYSDTEDYPYIVREGSQGAAYKIHEAIMECVTGIE